jgi:hypothetical protein
MRVIKAVCFFCICINFCDLAGQASQALEDSYIESFRNDIAFELLFLSDNPSKNMEIIEQNKLEFYRMLSIIKQDFGKNKESIYNLYDAIHDKYFVQYEENIKFHEIFQRGRYNCLTGTAMYAIALEYLEIPYKIIEQPTHVFLVVFHASGNYIFEATRPATSAILIDKEYVKWYKEVLVKNKIATRYEVNQPGFPARSIYNGNIITLQELVGDHYSNNAISYSKSGSFEMALNQAEMSYRLKESEEIKSLIIYSASSLINQSKISNTSDKELCRLVKTIVKYSDNSIEAKERMNQLVHASLNNLYIEKPAPIDLQSFMMCLMEGIEDTLLINSIESLGSMFIASRYIDLGELKKAKRYLDQCYDYDNIETRGLARYLFMRTAESISFEQPVVILDTLRFFEQNYPSILTDRDILKIKANMLLYAAGLNFDDNNRKKGEFYLNQFTDNFDPSDTSMFSPDLIGAAFGASSAYHVRNFNETKAKDQLVLGLKYDPDNIHLLRKKGYLDE